MRRYFMFRRRAVFLQGSILFAVALASCGKETTRPSAAPVGFISVSAGFNVTCSRATGGATYCWGENDLGALGSGLPTTGPERCFGTPCSMTPVAVAGGLSFASVSAGGGVVCGLTPGGMAYCWGYNYYGQLGNGTVTTSSTPTAVAGGLTFATVSAGGTHACGVTTGGAIYCWGDNGLGQLGDSSTANRSAPVAVRSTLTFASVSAGTGFTCAVTVTGAAYCWGWNDYGQLGHAATPNEQQCGMRYCRTTPVAVTGGLTFAAVSAGYSRACGVSTGGAAYCWGDNSGGELGNGTTGRFDGPVAVAGGLTVAAVSTSTYHACGLTTGGSAYCWGDNSSGELGSGSASSTVPRLVLFPGVFQAVRAGAEYSCGLTPDAMVYCWGSNVYGQLGDGTTTLRNTPWPVTFP